MSNIYFPEQEITFDDLKFVCFMIERTARHIKQPNLYVVERLGRDGLLRNLSLADVLHCENPDDVVDQWIEDYHLEKGSTDVLNVNRVSTPNPPTALQMGKVYARLIFSTKNGQVDLADQILNVYHSNICQQLDNYNCSAYYEPSYFITRAYYQGNFN
jgi:hypothetical protein